MWCDAGRGLAQHARLWQSRPLPSRIGGHAAGRGLAQHARLRHLCCSSMAPARRSPQATVRWVCEGAEHISCACHARTRSGATSAMTHLKSIMMTHAARSRRSRPRWQGPVGPTGQAPLSTLRDRVVSDPGLVIHAVGCHRESAGSQVEIPLKCRVLAAVHQGFNALSLSGGDWSVVAAVLVSLLFQS